MGRITFPGKERSTIWNNNEESDSRDGINKIEMKGRCKTVLLKMHRIQKNEAEINKNNKSRVTKQNRFFKWQYKVHLPLPPFRFPMPAKAPFCTCRKASLTVEAAFAAPVAIFFLVLLLSFFPILELQKSVEESMQCAARRAAASAVTEEEGADGSLTYAKGLFWKNIRGYDLPVQYITGGYAGISLLGSKSAGEYIVLAADYRVQMPVRLFGRQSFAISHKVKARKWNGYETGGGEEAASSKTVYITENGRAYHKDLSCNYLDLSIRSVSRAEVGGLRSADGSVYHECSSCGKKNFSSGIVYITTYGTEYHTALDCRGLKRTIKAVDLEEVQGRTPCPKCYGSHRDSD